MFHQLLELLRSERGGDSKQALKCNDWFLHKRSISGHNLENFQRFESGVPGWDWKQEASIAVFLPHSCDLGQCFQLFFCCPL